MRKSHVIWGTRSMHYDWHSVLTPALILAVAGLCLNLYLAQRTHARALKTEQARLYFAISERWSAILRLLYTVRRTPPSALAELESEYGTVGAFMESEAWREVYRPICNFFEDIGFIVYNDNLPLETVGVLVTVSESDYLLLKPVLDWVRRDYREDVYEFWNYLLWKAQNTPPAKPFSGRARYEPKAQ